MRTADKRTPRALSRRRAAALARAGGIAVALLGTAHSLSGAHASLSAATRTARTGPTVADARVMVGPSDCGAGWTRGEAGQLRFALRNDGPSPIDVYLQDAGGRIYLDLETLGAGATRVARVMLRSGSYRFVCAATDTGSVAGSTVKVTGRYVGPMTPGVLPVTDADLVGPVLAYQHWVHARLGRVRHQVRTLTRLLRNGEVHGAQRAWLSAHDTYITLGAAYDAFGDFGQHIDGLPRNGIPPPDDPDLTGFHKIEALLWHGRPTTQIVPYADKLGAAITNLRHHFGTDLALAPLDLGLRAHEILEDSLQLDLQEVTNAASHTELAAVDAAIAGTRAALRPLMPVLRVRDPDLPALNAWLDRLHRTVRSHDVHGRWTPLADLSRRNRERLDADLSETLELLSQVAVITDPVLPMPGGTP